MKDQETVQQFIELRARGLSYRAIAKQLDVAVGTLVHWSQQHQHLINNLQGVEWEEFLTRTLASKQQRVQALVDQLRRLETELAGRDLAAVATPRLQSMAEQLRRRLARECGSLQFSASVQISRHDDTRDAIQEWKA